MAADIFIPLYLVAGILVTLGMILIFPRKLESLKAYPSWIKPIVIAIAVLIFPIHIFVTIITEVTRKKGKDGEGKWGL